MRAANSNNTIEFMMESCSEEARRLKDLIVEGMRRYLKYFGQRYTEIKLIFEHFQSDPQEQYISKKEFLGHFANMGILKDDPRISSMVNNLADFPD